METSVVSSGESMLVGRYSSYLLAFLYLCAVWFSASPAFKFKTTAQLENDFPGSADQWDFSGASHNSLVGPSAVSIVPDSDETRARISKAYPLQGATEGIRFVAIRSRLVNSLLQESDFLREESSDAVLNPENSERLRPSLFYAWFEDKEGNTIRIFTLADLLQETSQQSSSNILVVPDEAVHVHVALLQRQFLASHTLFDLELLQLEKTLVYEVIFFGLMFVPIFLVLVAAFRWRFRISLVPALPVLVATILLILGVMLPGNLLNQVYAFIGDLAPSFARLHAGYEFTDLLDTMHFFGFLGLSVLVLTVFAPPKFSIVGVLMSLALFAVFTEVIQRHSIQRNSSIFDIVIDCSGILAGACIVMVLRITRSRWEKSRELA